MMLILDFVSTASEYVFLLIVVNIHKISRIPLVNHILNIFINIIPLGENELESYFGDWYWVWLQRQDNSI